MELNADTYWEAQKFFIGKRRESQGLSNNWLRGLSTRIYQNAEKIDLERLVPPDHLENIRKIVSPHSRPWSAG